MTFKASFCNPLVKDIIDLGFIAQGQIIETFNKTDWGKHLEVSEESDPDKVYYSPSLEVMNLDNQNGLCISAVGEATNYEFSVFYKRPKTVKRFFGLFNSIEQEYLSDIHGQIKDDVIIYLTALIKNDLDMLDRMIK